MSNNLEQQVRLDRNNSSLNAGRLNIWSVGGSGEGARGPNAAGTHFQACMDDCCPAIVLHSNETYPIRQCVALLLHATANERFTW